MNWKDKIKRKGLGFAPQEVSTNLETPEFASKDSRFTGRTKQLGLRVKPEFLKRLKELALEEDCFIVEVLEKAFQTYQQKEQSITTLQQTLKSIEKQVKTLQGTMSWKEVEAKLSKLNSTLFQQVGLPITYEVLKETLQEFARLDKEKRWKRQELK